MESKHYMTSMLRPIKTGPSRLPEHATPVYPVLHAHCNDIQSVLLSLLVHSDVIVQADPTTAEKIVVLFVLRFYGPVNPMGSCRARSVYLTTRLLGRLSPLSG